MKKPIPPSSRALNNHSEILIMHLSKLKPGDIATWKELQAVLPGIDLKQKRYIVDGAVRNLLKRHSIDIHSVVGVGLKRPLASESAGLGEDYRRRVSRSAKKCVRRLKCSDWGAMTNEERVKTNTALSMTGALVLFTEVKTRNMITQGVEKANAKLAPIETLKIPILPNELFGNGK